MTSKLHGLLAWIREHPAYQTLLDHLQAGSDLPAQSLIPQARAALVAALTADLGGPVVVIAPTVEEARRFREALRLWLPHPHRPLRFPEPPVLFYEYAPWTPEARDDRVNVLSRLFLHRTATQPAAPPVIVTSARAVMQRALPYRQFHKAMRKLAVGERVSLTGLARHASGIGYEPVSVVLAPGQFSRRGGLLDIFPPQAPHPYRLEFFGDEIDTLRPFDPATQRSIPADETSAPERIWLPPMREALPRDGERALPILERWLAHPELPVELRVAFEEDAQALAAAAPFPRLEYYLPYLYQETGTLLHYLASDALVVLHNAEQLSGMWEELEEEAVEQRHRLAAEGFQQETDAIPYVTWEQFEFTLVGRRALRIQSGEEGPLADAFTPEVHFAGRLPEALGRIRQWTGLGDQVVVVSRQASRMAELWQDFNPPPVHPDLSAPPEGLLTFVYGAASGGWQWDGPGGTRHLLTDEELFGWRPPEPRRRGRRRVAATPELQFADLQPGDYVVHEDYGIGVFRGLVKRSIDDIEREYLLLEYHERDRLFVPIHQADRLTRYVGSEGFGPSLSRLHTGQWAQTKARVQEAAESIAGELLDLYAARQVVQGHAFTGDTAWQRELEAAFPYIETADQIAAIQAVKEDMEKAQPMDRLICGDAGYGKTEVALRAAFKAVMDGKQAAMLVPTTVLAQQHYETFHERLAPFPVKVELLSRFRTPQEQGQVLTGMREGTVDIVIGTHRLLQRDIAFKDLGLVIIDEEQRFGVTHKERLKRLRTEVDVLTMTATPIPRTLYMSLTGVRDISIIETPPQERLPITTYIGPYAADVTQRAIRRELKRNGQVFYVHNRVETIASVAARLRDLVPEARIAYAHGQMQKYQLSRVMRRFARREIDVLLATTIIESGLDYPNANTLIVERADRFGLAQLYQLRGRVGRGTRRGYAYFFHKRRMTDDARARLQALNETSSTGGGFSVAMRDLEIRGAGNLLGRKQHGHVAAVGFTLYSRMLTRAVSRLKAERQGESAPPDPIGSISIELPLAVGLPPDYVPDDRLRLQLYRRMAELIDADDIAQLEDELRDRFGPLPESAENLIYQLRLKVLARDARIPAIAIENAQIALRPTWMASLSSSQVARLRRQLRDHARVGRREIWIQLAWDEQVWQRDLQATLEALKDKDLTDF